MAAPPLIALQSARNASTGLQKALTGDIYTRSTSRVVGKGKKAQIVDSTVHVNPVGIGLGAAALAAAAVGIGVAAWVLQLKLTPTRVNTYKTVIDQAAYTETRPIPEVGHWVDNVVAVGEPVRQWIEGTWIKGVYKPGQWVYTQPVQTVPGQHWEVIIPEGVDKIPHAAVTHQELTGTTKKFSIEQRRGFSAGDVLESAADAVGLGAPIAASRVIPKIVMDPLHVFKGKWWP